MLRRSVGWFVSNIAGFNYDWLDLSVRHNEQIRLLGGAAKSHLHNGFEIFLDPATGYVYVPHKGEPFRYAERSKSPERGKVVIGRNSHAVVKMLFR
ncbi:MAG TPA: hypothetical protein PLO16_03210 [Acidocella sp.]|nr:hypothetical protein [Acidocella sp.]